MRARARNRAGRRTVAGLALLLAATAMAAATPAAAQEVRLERRLDATTARAVSALVDTAAAASLPVEPLVQKALEGASKGASGAEVVAAVRALLRDLERARAALGGGAPDQALVLAAAALEAGAPADGAAGLVRLRPYAARSALPGGLAGLVYLLSRGLAADTAIGLVSAMLDAGLSSAEFSSLQRLVEQDVRGGLPSSEAATVRARALIRHGPRLGPGGTPDR